MNITRVSINTTHIYEKYEFYSSIAFIISGKNRSLHFEGIRTDYYELSMQIGTWYYMSDFYRISLSILVEL